jgi:hypothetical protein
MIARLDYKVFPFAIRFDESFRTFGTDAFDATLCDHFFAQGAGHSNSIRKLIELVFEAGASEIGNKDFHGLFVGWRGNGSAAADDPNLGSPDPPPWLVAQEYRQNGGIGTGNHMGADKLPVFRSGFAASVYSGANAADIATNKSRDESVANLNLSGVADIRCLAHGVRCGNSRNQTFNFHDTQGFGPGCHDHFSWFECVLG